ncbi:hypothetical protein [Serratia fonticola]|uniref:hypothetical protein n=1 Tax=Serratia fonticola TaxID=47917 RepID=UPI00192D0EB9|nr:hypothetical protein [Serratia fonticola]MBL5827660.1 hypothetical protein [Serratia fonticola]
MRRNNDYVRQSKKADTQKPRNYDVEYISSCMTLVQEQIQILKPVMSEFAGRISISIRLAMNTYQTKIGKAESFPVSVSTNTSERIFILCRVLGITIQQISKFDPQGAHWLTCISTGFVSELAVSSSMEVSNV